MEETTQTQTIMYKKLYCDTFSLNTMVGAVENAIKYNYKCWLIKLINQLSNKYIHRYFEITFYNIEVINIVMYILPGILNNKLHWHIWLLALEYMCYSHSKGPPHTPSEEHTIISDVLLHRRTL